MTGFWSFLLLTLVILLLNEMTRGDILIYLPQETMSARIFAAAIFTTPQIIMVKILA